MSAPARATEPPADNSAHLVDVLPQAANKRLALRVTKDALRQIRAGHPWIYDDSITRHPDGAAEPGDLAVVFDDDRKFRAIGLWDPYSPIRVKVLHQGRPETIDRAFFARRIGDALDLRLSLMAEGHTTGHRLINGENDQLPGFIVDRYDTTLVVKLYTSAWFPHLATLLDLLIGIDVFDVERVVLRLSRTVERQPSFGLADGDTIFGDPPSGDIVFAENGLLFGADVVRGQKTGHFFDQRDNRLATQHEATGDVLDVFSSTGGFSVYAAAGGADSVVSVDSNQQSLDAAERNMARNGLDELTRHTTICDDAFEVLAEYGRTGRKFDVVVIDPPSFAQKQADIDSALHAYRRLTRAGVALVHDGGLFVQASCSSRVAGDAFYQATRQAAEQVGVALTQQRQTGHALDHPIGFAHGGYLKALFARVQR